MSQPSDKESTSDIAISIGGSGARTAEALIYLCAAGLGPKKSLRFVFVDADTSNDSLRKVVELAKLYQKLQPSSHDDNRPIFRTALRLTDPEIWSPFKDGAAHPTLAEYFDYAGLKASKQAGAAGLMEALYGQDQRSAVLDVGFRGKPSIGAAIFSDAISPADRPWQELANEISVTVGVGQNVRIFAMGSVFGGTGAAGLPTIPRLLRNSVENGRDNVCLGAALLLPYFSFPSAGKNETVCARPELFTLNSREALLYYSSFLENVFNRIYVFGTSNLASQKKFALGGSEQKNLPHFVELVAAVGACDFFNNVRKGDQVVRFAGIESDEKMGWGDVPDQQPVHPAIGNFGRLCYFYSSSIYPRLLKLKDGKPASLKRTPWFQHLIVRRGFRFNSADEWAFFDNLEAFSRRFLGWLHDLQTNSGAIDLRLADSSLIPADGAPGFPTARFDGDIVFEGHSGKIALGEMWRRFCEQEGFKRSKLHNQETFELALHYATKGS